MESIESVASRLYTEAIIEGREGGTINLHGDSLPVDGYLVGGVVSPLVADRDTAGFEEVLRFTEYLSTLSVDHVGYWVDSETGKVYFDGVDRFGPVGVALDIGRHRGEIAIWDIARSEEIRINRTKGK